MLSRLCYPLKGFGDYFFFFLTFYFYFILLSNTVLVLPYIDMNPPRVYMRSQTWTPLPLPSPQHPSGSSRAPAPSMLYPASDIDWRFDSYTIVYLFQWDLAIISFCSSVWNSFSNIIICSLSFNYMSLSTESEMAVLILPGMRSWFLK